MEAPQPGSRGLGQRRGGRDAPLYFGIRSNVSRAQASSAHRPPKFAGLRARRFAGWLSFRAPHSLDLQGGRPVSEIADSLDVVAARRRAGRWFGRHDFPASAWRRLRHDCHAAPRRGDHQSDPRRALGEMVYLGGVARLRHFGRSTGAVADDGRGARRTRSDVPAPRGRGLLAAGQHGCHTGWHDARAIYKHHFCVRAYARLKYPSPVVDRKRGFAYLHGIDAEALDPARKSGAARLSFELGIRGGSTFSVRIERFSVNTVKVCETTLAINN